MPLAWQLRLIYNYLNNVIRSRAIVLMASTVVSKTISEGSNPSGPAANLWRMAHYVSEIIDFPVIIN